MATKPDCKECRQLMAIYGDEPDCDECTPEILQENKQAWEVFNHTHDQHIMAFSGPVAINLTVVFSVMERLGIQDQMDCVSRVKILHRTMIDTIKG